MKLIRLIIFTALFLMVLSTTVYAGPTGLSSFPDPVDPKSWVLPEDMTWDDYQPVPGIDWRDTDVEPEMEIKGALIVVDFDDREFIISQEEGSMEAGNPIGVGNIPREEIGQFWVDFLNEPQPINNYRTIDEYWRENSYGKWSIDLQAFGPYRMDGKEFQYGLNEFGQQANMPPGYETMSLRPEAMEKAREDMEASGEDYDFTFILHAGYDESGVWQEFGEMMFQNPESVIADFGPPAEFDMPNWATTRYVDWTSWVAAKSIWSSADIRNGISVQGENDGMGTFAHEFGHIMNLLDNYNNPYANPVSRSYSGTWELMSRGSFNGPGGPHTRWMVMPNLGGSAPSHHMLRNKIKQGFLTEDQYLNLDRDELAETGPVFADILARSVPAGDDFGRTALHGINIEMEDLTPANSLRDDWRADMQRGEKWYDNYTIEVVDRVGFDSFAPDSGVLVAKTKNSESAPNIWVIDSHPEDINQVDFTRPDGTETMYSKGDYRQLADALFKAGTDSEVVSEYVDEHNRLHFYILDNDQDEEDALSYRVAVRHLDGAGDFERGLSVESGEVERALPGRVGIHNFSVTNTGEETDLFRIQAETDSGWEKMIEHNVIEVAGGETVDVPVYVEIPEDAEAPANLTFTATSETDPDQTTTIVHALFNDRSAAGIKAFVEHLDEQGEFTNATAVRALTTHLTAVDRYENQNEIDKVIKHMESFKLLLGYQLDNDLLTATAAEALQVYSDFLLEQWEGYFNSSNAMDHLSYLSVDLGPRVAGTDEEKQAAQYIQDEFERLGYDASIQEFGIRGDQISQNVMAVIQPEDIENPEIIHVTAHYDSVPGSPGANDNGSGTSALLELARIMKDNPTDKEIRFVAFGAEEIGLVGSRYYVSQLSEDEINRSAANFNMDMIGTNWEPATQLYVNVVDGSPNTVWQYAEAAADKLDNDTLFLYQRGASDHVPFYDAGIDAANFIWREPGTAALEPYYHTPQDTIDRVSPEKIQMVGELIYTAVTDLSLE